MFDTKDLRSMPKQPPQNDDRKKKIKVAAASTVLALCSIWFVIFYFTSCRHVETVAPDSPGIQESRRVTEELNKQKEFIDVGFSLVSESPLRFTVNGAVHKQAHIEPLKAKLKELHPEEDYDFEVEVMP